MLSQQPSPLPSPLPSPPPPPPPQPENGGESDLEPPEKKQKIDENLSDLEPPEKKQKIDENLTASDGEGEMESDDSESSRFGTLSPLTVAPGPFEGTIVYGRDDYDMEKDLYTPIYPGDVLGDKACWKKYFQQIHESEGFDIKDFPGYGPLTTIHPYKPSEKIKGYAAQALKLYNEDNGTKYEVNEILKVNRSTCQYFSFYITFTVMNGNGEKIYFQAQVDEDVDGSLDFEIVRPRAKGGLDI